MVLIEILARNMGEVVTRKEIAEAFGVEWLQFDGRRLNQVVSRLRRRWLKNSGVELPFRTEHGRGYIFVAKIDLV